MDERLEEYSDEEGKKFNGDGVVFKGKLYGIDPVTGPRGDKMCQNAMQRLKAIAKKAKGTHKERIQIHISFEGIKICNEKSGDVISQQKINLISYISRDANDARSFGYVYGSPETGHQFIGFKIEKSAIPVMKTIGELFKYVYEKRKQEKCEQQNNTDNLHENYGEFDVSGNKETHKSPDTTNAIAEHSHNGSAYKSEVNVNRYAKWEAFTDDDKSSSNTTANQKPVNATIAAKKAEFPTLPLPKSPKRSRTWKKSIELESPFGLTSSTEFEREQSIPTIFDSSLTDVMFTSLKTPQPQNVDRYAAFAEINSMSSLFDSLVTTSNSNEQYNVMTPEKVDIDLNSSTVSSPDLWNKALNSSQSSLTNVNLFASLPSPQKPRRSPVPISRETEVMFSELNPLGSLNVEQYIDRNVFFQTNKKPCLNELDNGSQKSLDSTNDDRLNSSVTDPFGNSFDKNAILRLYTEESKDH